MTACPDVVLEFSVSVWVNFPMIPALALSSKWAPSLDPNLRPQSLLHSSPKINICQKENPTLQQCFFHSKFSIKKHHHLYTNLYVASNACFNNADISFYCINTFKLSGSHACYRFTDMHHVTYNKRKKDVQKLMNKYLVSWTLLFPEKKVFLMCPPGRPGPGRCVWPLRSAPGRLGEPSQQGPGPAVAAPKQALVWIYSSSVRPLTNQYKLTLVTCAHWWTPCVRTNSALHKTILSKLLVSYTSAKKELFGPLLAITVLNLS